MLINKTEKRTISKRFDLDGVISGQVKKRVLQHAPMSCGEHKPITIEPVRILGVVPHDLIVQYVGHGSAAHGQTRVTRIRLLHGINCQETDCVDGLLDEFDISFF